MPKRVFSRIRSPRKGTSEFSSVSDGGMFESRPFVVESKVGEEGQRSELKTSLMQAQRYGHHLSRMPLTDVSTPKTIQPKAGMQKSMQLKKAEASQVIQAMSGKKSAKNNNGKKSKTNQPSSSSASLSGEKAKAKVTYRTPQLKGAIEANSNYQNKVNHVFTEGFGSGYGTPQDGGLKHAHVDNQSAICWKWLDKNTLEIVATGVKSTGAKKGSGGYDWDTKGKNIKNR